MSLTQTQMTCQQNPHIPQDASQTSANARHMPEKLGAVLSEPHAAQEIAWAFQSLSVVTINQA